MDIEDLNWVTREVGALTLVMARELERLTGVDRAELVEYALVIVATGQAVGLAAMHVRETGALEYAMGRLLMGAAEVSFRESGEPQEKSYG